MKSYEDTLQENIDYYRDPAYGFQELIWLKAMKEEEFPRLEKAVNEASQPDEIDSPSLPKLPKPVQDSINKLIDTSNDLNSVIYREIGVRLDASRNDRTTLAFVIGTCIIAVLLTTGLVRFFYRWVCYPIRDLEAGVGRVAKGDFEYKIEVHSGDEIEDLAKAFNDMTGRLREMYRDLAQQVNERSRQLVRSERLAGVGFLAAGVAHEINNPLASIAFCSEALEQRLNDLFHGQLEYAEDQEREIITKYLKMIQEEAFRCKAITERLLAFSRGSERKREQTDIGELIQGVLDMVQHMPNCKGKELIFNPAEKITAWVNAQEIKQVFLNLVVNALDSMDEKGRLLINQSIRDGMVELEFEDNGCGMTSEVLENIFEPFFTKSRTGKGTGLGLSISHRIITQHGGDIEAKSNGRDQGSNFRIRLPLQPPENMKDQVDLDDHDPKKVFAQLSSASRTPLAA